MRNVFNFRYSVFIRRSSKSATWIDRPYLDVRFGPTKADGRTSGITAASRMLLGLEIHTIARRLGSNGKHNDAVQRSG